MTRLLMSLIVVAGLWGCGGSDDETWGDAGVVSGLGPELLAVDGEVSPAQKLMLALMGKSSVDAGSGQKAVGLGGTDRSSSPDPMPGRQRDDDEGPTGTAQAGSIRSN